MIFIDPFAVTKLKLLLVNVNNYLASHLVKLLAIAQHVLDDIQPVQTSNKEVEDALWSYMYYLSLKKLPKIIFVAYLISCFCLLMTPITLTVEERIKSLLNLNP